MEKKSYKVQVTLVSLDGEDWFAVLSRLAKSQSGTVLKRDRSL